MTGIRSTCPRRSTTCRTRAKPSFWYGPDRARVKQYQSATGATIRYAGTLFEFEDAATDTYRHYVQAGDKVIAVVERVGTTNTRQYLHRDHQGSVVKVTDAAGSLLQSLAFDAWGLRRNASDWSALGSPFAGSHETERGYTGHEHLDTVGLIHMNGRVQDPALGRFISADPFVQAPFNTQSHNRYSYVWNNPTSYIDPSGFQWEHHLSPELYYQGHDAFMVEMYSDWTAERITQTYRITDVASGTVWTGTTTIGFAIVPKEGNPNDSGPWYESNGALLARDIGGGVVDAFTPVGDIRDVSTAWSNGRYWTAGAFTAVGVGSYLCGPAKKACSGLVGRLLRLDTCCFVAGTLILTEEGLVPIEEIEEGDRVWSRDPETGETALKPVTALIRRHEREIWEVEIAHADGAVENFETTDDHPWWIEGAGWVETADLVAGQQVTTKHHGLSGIRRVERTDRVNATYNLTVADFETYFVGEQGVLVHNCSVFKGKSNRELNEMIGNDQRNLVRNFFGTGIPGATARADNFAIPNGLTRESLEIYREIGQRAIAAGNDSLGVHAARLELIERALRSMD